MALELLFVDGNGTVLDDWRAAHAGAIATLRAYGKEFVPLEVYAREIGEGVSWHEFYECRGIDPHYHDLYPIFSPAYHACLEGIHLMDGAYDALSYIRDAGIAIHLLTAAPEDLIKPVLERYDVLNLFAVHHYGIDNKTRRIRQVVQEHAINPKKCAMVGDLPSDVHYANEAGVHSIGLQNPHVPQDIFDNLHGMNFFALSFWGVPYYVLADH